MFELVWKQIYNKRSTLIALWRSHAFYYAPIIKIALFMYLPRILGLLRNMIVTSVQLFKTSQFLTFRSPQTKKSFFCVHVSCNRSNVFNKFQGTV